jgi:choline-glycine betaine transporter
MKNKTVRIIVILLCLLFLNIEAAHAGLIQKFKSQVLHEFSDFQLFYLIFGLSIIGFLSYVIFTPISIGKEKLPWYKWSTFSINRHNFNNKRIVIKKIAIILNNS